MLNNGTRRVSRLVAHLQPSETSELLPPSMAQLKQKLEPFIRVALPFSGVRIEKNLGFQVEAMNQVIDHCFFEWRQQVLQLLATHPSLQRKHTLCTQQLYKD